MKWSYEGNIGKSSALKAKEIGVIIGKKILILTSQAGYVVGRIIIILSKSSEELPEIVTKRVNLNERLAQEARKETGVDCEAAELNSLAIENRPYYSSKLPMSPKIVTNRGCIKVNGKSFGLIQIIQR